MVWGRLNKHPENILKLLPLSLQPAMALASCFPQSSAMLWGLGVGGELTTCSDITLDWHVTSPAHQGGSVKGLNLGALRSCAGASLLHQPGLCEPQEPSRISAVRWWPQRLLS